VVVATVVENPGHLGHFSRAEARYSLTAPGSTIDMLDRKRTCAMKNRVRQVRACRSAIRVRYGLPTCQRASPSTAVMAHCFRFIFDLRIAGMQAMHKG
jgi:hypothetical protein